MDIPAHLNSPDANAMDTPKRRRRPPLSCIICRRRKLKCDRCEPCSQCVKSRTEDNCIYVPQPSLTRDEDLEGEGVSSQEAPGCGNNRAASMERNLHVFHAKGDNRISKKTGGSRVDELQELRGRVMRLETALVKNGPSSLSSVIQTPESLGDEGGCDVGKRLRADEGISPMVDVMPDPCFRGTNDKTKYVGRSNYALTMSLVSRLLSRRPCWEIWN